MSSNVQFCHAFWPTMFETLKRPLKVFGECDPNNVWYEKWDNGTFFKGGQLFELWQFQSKFKKGIRAKI